MKHESQGNILKIKSKDLFAKAKCQNGNEMMEFTLFYDWIEKEVKYIKHMDKYKKVLEMIKNDKDNKEVTERKVKKMGHKKGIKYVKHFVIINDYF